MHGKTEGSEEDIEDYLRFMDKKIIWKDNNLKNDENIGNGAFITPLYSITTSHFWIRRNMIPISDEEYFFVSGTNIILANMNDESQKIIYLKPDCAVTSLFFSISSTNERLIIVGEKIKSVNPNKNPPECYSPRVEIINLDNKIIKERRVLDHTFFTNNKNSYILDAIIPNNSDLCYSLVKSCDPKDFETKLFVWEYIPLLLKTIFTYEGHIEAIVPDPKNGSKLIFYNLFHIGIFQYQHTKKKINLEKLIDTDYEIADITFLKNENGNNSTNSRILVGYQDQSVELFDQDLCHIKHVKINDMFDQVLENFQNDEEEENKKEENKTKLIRADSIYDMSMTKSIVYIISRENLLFIFFSKTRLFLIMTISQSEEFEIFSIEFLKTEVTDKSSFMINSSANIMYFINGESKIEGNQVKLKTAKRLGFSKKRTTNNLFENQENEKFKFHTLEKRTITYSKYNINIKFDFKNDYDFALEFEKNGIFSPLGIYSNFETEIMKETSNEFDTKGFTLSNNPRYMIFNLKTNYLVISQEEGSNTLENFNLDLDNNSAKGKSYELVSNISNIGTDNKPSVIKYRNILTKKMEYEPMSIAISPYGDYFFLANDDGAYVYGILDHEVKELYKVTSTCRSGTFSETGRYFAFSNSEYSKDDFTISIVDSRTFETEYVITNLHGHANSMKWMDSDRILVALVDEKDIYGWHLGENRVISVSKDKFEQNKTRQNKNEVISTFLRLVDYGEKIIDFCYDYYTDFLLIIGEEKMIKLFSDNCEESWEFEIECKYTSSLLIRKLDIILFGTNEGAIRIYIWPIPNFTKKGKVDPPAYYEKFLHGDPVIQLFIEKDLNYLYSCCSNGSIFVSSLNSFCNDTKINLNSFIYFDPKYMLNRKVYSKYSDFLQYTYSIYKSKCNTIAKYEEDINGMNIEFTSEIDKLNGENSKSIEDKKYFINTIIEKERRKVKNIQEEKEISAKQLKEKRENQLKIFKEEIKKMKKVYKQEKDSLQNTTKILSNQIKDVKMNYNNYLSIIDNKKNTNELKLNNLLNNVIKNLNVRLGSIKKINENKECIFKKKIYELEEDKESYLKDEENLRKYKKEKNNIKILELTSDIEKILKDNRNHVERISEWEKNLTELRENNADLMESFLFNTLKLKQMNKTLIENEGKISNKEVVVMGKRESNERLEKLRFVLEYQIKNLMLERLPIEEQIKNFEDLNNDFYQRFNLLYAEQLNIEDFINENLNLIDNFRDDLSSKKKSMYVLKNILQSLGTEINFIIKAKIDEKNDILIKLDSIHKKYLQPYLDKNSYNIFAQETKLQSKLMIKEIKTQKDKVLKDLSKKSKDIANVRNEKDELMFKIQQDNTLLIDECSSIRLNLEDILKYINDIEKKFIELTNTNFFLIKNPAIKKIKNTLKNARDQINDADIDKAKIAKNANNAVIKNKFLKTHNAMSLNKKNKNFMGKNNDIKKFNKTNINNFPSNGLLNKLEMNKYNLQKQDNQLKHLDQKIKEVIGIDLQNSSNNQSYYKI